MRGCARRMGRVSLNYRPYSLLRSKSPVAAEIPDIPDSRPSPVIRRFSRPSVTELGSGAPDQGAARRVAMGPLTTNLRRL